MSAERDLLRRLLRQGRFVNVTRTEDADERVDVAPIELTIDSTYPLSEAEAALVEELMADDDDGGR